MNYQLTGNPFVDTGIFAMQAHASKLHGNKQIDALTPALLTEVLGGGEAFGRWLAKANRHLNSFFMVVGTNSDLVNPSKNKKLYKTNQRGFLDEEDTGWQDYLKILKQLHGELSNPPDEDAPICESCGERPATNVLTRVGRDFFPLAGSLGNDAQALPAASRAPRVCALCLIAIQWVPLGAIMFNGRLACFQFTEPLLTQYFVEDTYRETRARLDLASIDKKVLVPGSQEGATPAARLLIDRMRRLQADHEEMELPPGVTLNIWAFSNTGASPDCEVIEIHHPALQFLWESARDHHTEIFDLLNREDSKKPTTHLLSAIGRGVDYSGFYPRKGSKSEAKAQLVSPQLYELYQIRILARPRTALEAAKRLATLIHARLSAGDKKEQKLLTQILKENPRWVKDKVVRVTLRRFIAAFAEDGRFTLELYAHLFPAANLEQLQDATLEAAQALWREPGAAVRATSQGWDLFWFYLHHAANGTLAVSPQGAIEGTNTNEDLVMFTNPKIKQFAQDVFAAQLERRGGADRKRGLVYIKRNIVDAFGRGKITVGTLRNWFSQLAEIRPDYTNEDWDALCRDEQGRDAMSELRFQMRLEIANLYRNAKEEETLVNKKDL